MRPGPLLALLALVGSTAVACDGSAHTSGQTAPATRPLTGTTTASARATPIAPKPRGVAVQSVTFVSATMGWLLGTSAGRERVEETTDGGAHWSPLAAIPPGSPTGVRFADAAHGYAFSRLALDVTMNGGQSWRRVSVPDQDGDGMGAVQVETASGRVWLLNAASPYPAIFESLVGSTDFHQVGMAGNRGAELSVQGPYAYVLGVQGAGPVDPNLEIATIGGTGVRRPIPCVGIRPGAGAGAGALTPLAAPNQLVLACIPYRDGAANGSSSVLYRSTDNGEDWSRLGTAPCAIGSLTRNSTTVFGTCATGVVRLPLSGGAATTSLTAAGLGYVGFTDDHDGMATSDSTGQPGALYLTRDAGAHWTKAVT